MATAFKLDHFGAGVVAAFVVWRIAAGASI
jgi:hypothetical protein